MASFQRFIGGLKGLVRSRRFEQELDEELRAYLESSVEARVRAGMTPENAWRAARAEFGSIEAVKDHTRGVGWETSVEQAWRDVRYGARTLRRSPAFAAVVVLTLTLGIGANTAIFSAVNAIMLRALPAERPDELISMTALYPNGAEPFSYVAYRRIAAEGARLVDALAASNARRDAITVDGPPEAEAAFGQSARHRIRLAHPRGFTQGGRTRRRSIGSAHLSPGYLSTEIGLLDIREFLEEMVRPARLERATSWFVAVNTFVDPARLTTQKGSQTARHLDPILDPSTSVEIGRAASALDSALALGE